MALRYAVQDAIETLDVHCFSEDIFHHFANERVIGDSDVALDVFLACLRFGEHGGKQIVRTHALDRRRNFLATSKTQEREGAASVPAPACSE